MAEKEKPAPFNNRQEIKSPLTHWPGYIVLPVELSPVDFSRYWETYQKQTDDPSEKRHETIRAWESRFHIVKDWKIEGLRSEQVAGDGMAFPSLKLMVWVVQQINDLIIHSLSLPNSPAPSSDAETQSETARP